MNDTCELKSDYVVKLSPKSKHFRRVFALTLMMSFIFLVLTTKACATEPSSPDKQKTETKLTSADAQKLWNKSCFTCHGDSGDMARNFLKVVDGELHGPMHKANFRLFLTNHYLSQVKANAIYAMLLTQANAKSRFDQECGTCHETMGEFIREKLALYEGILYSRKLKTPTYGFLESHRELKKDDVLYFMKKLTFKGYEIYQPVKME